MSPENSSNTRQQIEYVKKSLPPEMAKAADTFPPEEFLQRVEIYRDLQKAYDTLEKNSKRLTSMKDTYLTPLREIQNMQHWVATSAKGDFARFVTTKFEGWEGDDMNFNYTDTDTVSVGELIARYSKNSKRVGEFLGGTPDQVGKEKDAEGYDRIATFIDALETRSDDAEISAAIAKYRTRVGGTLAHTTKLLGDLEKIIVEKRNSDAGTLRFDVIKASDANLASALRVIGDTANSGVVATRKMKRQSDGETSGDDAEDVNYKKLGEFYQKNYDGFKESAQQDAQKQFDEILKSLEGYPQYLEYQNKKTEIIASITEQNIFMKATDKYISAYGGEKLGAIGKLYDDMKGLYGAFNFTDENAAMTKELAITFVSMALSFGTAGILLGVARVAGGVRAALAAKNLATVAEDAGRMRKATTLAKNAGTTTLNALARAPMRGVAWVAEKGFAGAAGAVRAVESGGMIVRTAGEALKFTTAQTVLEAYGPLAQGDGSKRASLESFAKKFAQNAIMFGAFAGVEKFLSGPLIAKLGISAQKGIITQKNIVLSAGDVSALYLLHGLETGDFELTPNMIAMTVAFRAVPGMAEKFAQAFPKLNTKLASYKSSVPEGITLSQEDYAIALTKVPQHFRDQIGAEAYIRMIEKTARLSNPERILEAERILRRSLNQEEKDALILAHNTGEGSIFQWSTGDLKAKLEILQYGKRRAELPKKQRPEKELFTQEERAKLMESGLTGKVGETVVPRQEEIGRFIVNELKRKRSSNFSLDSLGLTGWKVTKIPKQKGKTDNQFTLEIPGESPMLIQGRKQLEKIVQTQARERDMGKPQTETLSEQAVTPREGGTRAEETLSAIPETQFTRTVSDEEFNTIQKEFGGRNSYTLQEFRDAIKQFQKYGRLRGGAPRQVEVNVANWMSNNDTDRLVRWYKSYKTSLEESKTLLNDNKFLDSPELGIIINDNIRNYTLSIAEMEAIATARGIRLDRVEYASSKQGSVETTSSHPINTMISDELQYFHTHGKLKPMDGVDPGRYEVQNNVEWIMSKSDAELKDVIQNYYEVLKSNGGNILQDEALVFNMLKEAAVIRGIKLDGIGGVPSRAHDGTSEGSVTTTQHTPAESVPKSSSTDFILVGGETTPAVTFDIVAARERLATIKQELVEREASKKNYVGKSTTDFVENQVAIDRIKKEIQDLEGSITRSEKGAPQGSQGKREEMGTTEDDLASVLKLENNDSLRESLRTKIQDLMKLDDVAFEKSYNDAEARQWNNNEYEREIYTAARGVRTRTLEQLPTDVTFYKERTAEYRKNQRDISEDGKPVTLDAASKSMKAQFVFARIASEYRLKNTPRDIAIAKDHNQFPAIIRDGTNRIKIVTPEGPIALPEGTKVLPPEAAKNPTDWTRKAWGLGGLLLIGGILYACSGDDKNKMLTPVSLTNPTTPIAAPVTPEEACRDIGTKVSEINIRRDNGRGDILTTQTREIITKRFMGSREFQTFQTFLNDHNADIQSKTACNDILEFLKPPTVANIQELQRRINMNASDDKNGQDGILGPITLKQLQKYLETELAK